MKQKTDKIAVFASGNGSNFEAIVTAIEQGSLQVEVALLVVDKPQCYAAERAKNRHIEVFAFQPKNYSSKEAYETEIAALLEQKEVKLIVLAGYMRLIGSVLLSRFAKRILNIHPALLPAFPGLHAIEQAYNYGVKIFGITIHYVDAGMDTGEIVAQECFHVEAGDSLEAIETRIHALEHKLYPSVIQQIINTL
ncbi:MAG: phosphoribosylglycinamide formyltransferase [Bacteroidales bacterium]|jgi:phosphoribosylglycinamide formyltransferase-1|nr:phosphoribosylglycinamide formyltransferase [Bacteroidales bacterium]